ncbi:MAG TPA: lysophospholipid acyltransferase family protein [Candidatus Acidoferrales bacterium]|nr:lysophospholipid acyltransferase family protein [Candidatus Acidoferrales bacterium]
MRRVRGWLEYSALWIVLKIAGLLPRGAARRLGAWCAHLLFALQPKLRRTAEFNLALAFPDWSDARRSETIRRMVVQLGWMAGEFSQFPKYSRTNISSIVSLEGHENFLAARANGKGVLILTGHIGAWELSPYAHALYGYPLSFLARAVENSKVDELVNRYRGLAGNEPIEKNRAAREMLRILGRGETIGILADQNTLPEEGVFVDFFGVPACTTSGLARIALRTGAAVVPGYVLWDDPSAIYRLCFEPSVQLARSGDEEQDVLENTARFAKVIERVIREHPDQWVWVHKRWKTRPPGEKPLYP